MTLPPSTPGRAAVYISSSVLLCDGHRVRPAQLVPGPCAQTHPDRRSSRHFPNCSSDRRCCQLLQPASSVSLSISPVCFALNMPLAGTCNSLQLSPPNCPHLSLHLFRLLSNLSHTNCFIDCRYSNIMPSDHRVSRLAHGKYNPDFSVPPRLVHNERKTITSQAQSVTASSFW